MVAFVGAAAVTSGSSNQLSLTGSIPAGVTAGDVLIATVSRTHNYPLTATEPGWTLLRNIIDPGSAPAAAHTDVFWRVTDDADPPPAFAVSASTTRWTINVAAYRGVDTAAPFLAENGQGETGPGSTTAHSAPTLTNTDPSAWLVFHLAFRQVDSPASVVHGAGLVERLDTDAGVVSSTNLVSTWADSGGPVPAGSVASSAASPSGTALAVMWAGLLRPAAPIADVGFFLFFG